MCGIIGMISKNRFESTEAFKRLKKLEYRGYDSFGYFDGNILFKQTGEIKIPKLPNTTNIAILHTRWSTHGKVTEHNAHPHQSCNGDITVVHNGIIENYNELKQILINKGHIFTSQTDSETIAHYFEDKLNDNLFDISMEEICQEFMNDFKGTFAVLVIKKDDNKIYALKRDSPLVLGITDDTYYLASDIYAFSDATNKAIFFDNDEFAVIEKDRYSFFDKIGSQIDKEPISFSWEQTDSIKAEYPHYMIKEIIEQPAVCRRLLNSLEAEQKENFNKFIQHIKNARKVVFVAAGTSYHASLLGAYYLHKCGKEAQALIASEFENFANLDDTTLVIPLSQSGETLDCVEALKYARSKNAQVASIVNVPYSTIQRISDISLNTAAGQEVAVASTKSFVNQVTLLLKIANEFGYEADLSDLPQKIQKVIDKKEEIKKIAESISDKKDLYILGRGMSYPVAREVALKIKEISYIHAEGMMGGELKHGTIALIEDGTPVISLISNHDYDMVSNTMEVESRGANAIRISNELQGEIMVETKNDGKYGILASIAGQLLAYYIALKKGLPIDKPRNLAKSVTVK